MNTSQDASASGVQVLGQSTEHHEEAVTANIYKREAKRVDDDMKEAKTNIRNTVSDDSRRSTPMAPVEELSESMENMPSARERNQEPLQYGNFQIDKYKQYSIEHG